ncbi:YbgC/FadM family acyl-CoA thioesterase [Candidatus Pelagibacter sp. RS40]|uniref:YbgC/FadM family acyl-CoA thioesterase n=1 Tax=Candidatus Pelagibacter sp. RS40 TaxID=1977865 RepID=UPI000A14BF41|nr:YbgC/FadM family acyl-CoA thioesterase [Candidatus Pelagibacter sp. RS40]ARJ48538.1 4-hydroxybenzoyl-CoA thioesterase [Candidatus Pelagibacter sp. RS40]
MSKQFKHKVKIYYEDTDAGGVVYYANYLKYLERARSEAIYSLGLTNTNLQKEHDSLIIVKSCNIEYKKPARFEDELEIISSILSKTRTSFTMKQIIKKNEEIISEATVQLVTVNKEGKPIKIPEILNNLLN